MQPTVPSLLLLPVLEAMRAWLGRPDAVRAGALGSAVVEVGARIGLDVRAVRVEGSNLPSVDVDRGSGGAALTLRAVNDDAAIGSLRCDGDEEAASSLARSLELLLSLTRAQAIADHATAQLRALDQAVRGISGVLDLDRVLQVIVDRVRELASAQYAALGIADPEGTIERFITSGITDQERFRIGDLPRGRGLLGLIIRESRSYRIPEIADHPDSFGFPPNHPEMHSFLGMPIRTSDSVVGRLYLTNKLGEVEFSDDDQALVEMFAMHAGIAIENAGLHDQVRRLAVVDERDRISRDLHDSVIQSIYAQTLSLDDVPDLVGEDPAEARRRVDEAIDALHAVIRDIRNFIFGLRPVLLESGSLTDGLEQLAAELRRNGGIDVAVEADATQTEDLPIEIVAELLAVTREALSNIARHAGATGAMLVVERSGEAMRLEIRDDGRGFDATTEADRGHHGIANMRARTEALGGRFSIDSRDTGTRIIITLPADPRIHRRGDQ